jgi:hypothetical protein
VGHLCSGLAHPQGRGRVVTAGGVEVGGVVGVVGGGVVVGFGWGTCATVRTIWVPTSTVSPACVCPNTVPSGWLLSTNFVVVFNRALVRVC